MQKDTDTATNKLQMANKFLDQAEKMLPTVFTNELEMADSLRSILMIIDIHLSLGNSKQALKANGTIFNRQDSSINFPTAPV